jgi:glycosyltransferase involved in cell wall biosynthesis
MSCAVPPAAPHLLHVFSTFVPAGPEMRTVRLIEALGSEFRHSIVAIDGRTDAAAQIARDAPVTILPSPPRAGSFTTIRRLRALFREAQPDVLLTYNWGAFDGIFAAKTLGMKRVIHHEDGFNADESEGFKDRRVQARRWFLPGVHAVVVPSRKLYGIATELWKLAPDHVRCIPNGIRLERFRRADRNIGLRDELGIPAAALVVGYVGHLRAVKNPLRLLRACARIDPEIDFRVLVLGDGEERATMEELAAKTPTLFGRVVFAGYRSDPADFYRAMDLFAISSDSEQMPVALVEAMACGLPVVSTDVGDVRAMLPDEQGEFVLPLEKHETAWPMAEKLAAMLRDGELRARLGAANRVRAEASFAFETMLGTYRDLYRSALPSRRE